MIRAVIEGLALFLAPFALFGLWLYATRDLADARAAFRSAIVQMTIAGIALCIVSVLWLATHTERHSGAYAPAELKDGRIVPGHIQ
jgi:uncharacterized membrane protein